MRKVTKLVTEAFMNGRPLKVSNTWTDGVSLFLHGNKIAEKRGSVLRICCGGHKTATTKERLNALPNVEIHQKNGEWYMNNQKWSGVWTIVNQ